MYQYKLLICNITTIISSLISHVKSLISTLKGEKKRDKSDIHVLTLTHALIITQKYILYQL